MVSTYVWTVLRWTVVAFAFNCSTVSSKRGERVSVLASGVKRMSLSGSAASGSGESSRSARVFAGLDGSSAHSGWPRKVSAVKVGARAGGMTCNALGGRAIMAGMELTKAHAQAE